MSFPSVVAETPKHLPINNIYTTSSSRVPLLFIPLQSSSNSATAWRAYIERPCLPHFSAP